MEHNVFLQAFDDKGNMHTWEYCTIKRYLVAENHVHHDREWKFHKAIVSGVELGNRPNGEIAKDCFRDVSDFKIYCRKNVNRKHIKSAVTREVLDQFLLEESEEKRKANYIAIQSGAKNLDSKYVNLGCSRCEYRPGQISGYDFSSKGVKIEWINEDADVCEMVASRTTIFNRIRELIRQDKYYSGQAKNKPCPYDKERTCNFKNAHDVKLNLGEICDRKCCWGCNEICGVKCNPWAHGVQETVEKPNNKPKPVFYGDKNQLPGQLSIFDL